MGLAKTLALEPCGQHKLLRAKAGVMLHHPAKHGLALHHDQALVEAFGLLFVDHDALATAQDKDRDVLELIVSVVHVCFHNPLLVAICSRCRTTSREPTM